MATFLQAYEEAEAAGVLHGAEPLPTGDYTIQLGTMKAGTTKKGDPTLSILAKTTDGRSAFINLNYIPDNQVGNALTIQMLQEFGITRAFMSQVDTTQGLAPFIPELQRVSTGRWYEVSVVTKPGTGQYAGKMNSNFRVRTNGQAPQAAQFQGSPPVQPAPAPVVQPVAVQPAPAPVVAAPQPLFDPMTGQPLSAATTQVITPAQVAPILQPAGIPQPVQVDPATGLPPRPGI